VSIFGEGGGEARSTLGRLWTRDGATGAVERFTGAVKGFADAAGAVPADGDGAGAGAGATVAAGVPFVACGGGFGADRLGGRWADRVAAGALAGRLHADQPYHAATAVAITATKASRMRGRGDGDGGRAE
jgi:hypothetical protein